MAKEKINEYIHGIKSTSYLLDIDENNNSFKRVCIFFNHPITNGEIEMHLNKNDSAEMLIEENNEVFINTENVDARIEHEKEMFKEFNE